MPHRRILWLTIGSVLAKLSQDQKNFPIYFHRRLSPRVPYLTSLTIYRELSVISQPILVRLSVSIFLFSLLIMRKHRIPLLVRYFSPRMRIIFRAYDRFLSLVFYFFEEYPVCEEIV